MKKLRFRVLTVVIVLCFTGTTLSRKSDIFFCAEYQWDEHPLANCSTRYMDVSQRARVDVSFRSLRLLVQPRTKKEQNRKHLDLSNHLISKVTLSPPANWRAVEILNLSDNGILSISLGLPTLPSSQLKCPRSSFGKGFPFLKVLSLQRNELSATPRGLWRLKSLQSVDLSFNRILQLGPSDFHNCLRLESINLKSNRIFKIHPEAFKDLKNLQVVDLSNNALTTTLPLLTLALEFPHLEVDLAGNRWQCEDGVVDFQNFISESWKQTWSEICNKSVGSKGASLETSKIRSSRETHLPHSTPNPGAGLIQSEAERPQEGRSTGFSTLRKEAVAGPPLGKTQERQPTGVGTPRDGEASSRKEDGPPDLALAICLSVFITFAVAFCLGAFSRPYIDRLWQQRHQNKSPRSDNVFSNEGFHDEIEGARGTRHQRRDLHQPSQHPLVYENRSPSWGTGPSPHATARPGRTLGQEPSSQQSPAKPDSTGAKHRDDDTLPNGQMPGSTLHRHLHADNHELMPSAQNHIYNNDRLKELHSDSLHKGSAGSKTSTGQTVSSSTHGGWNELDLSRTRELAASLPKMLALVNTHGAGDSQERGCPEQSPLETVGSQRESCKEMEVRNSISVLGTHQPRLQEASTDDSAFYSEVTHSDTTHVEPLALLPRWDPTATPGPEKPVEKESPFDPHYDDMETNYGSDSDEGSLFTLSSEGSKDSASVTEEQDPGRQNGSTSQPLPAGNSGEHGDSVASVRSLDSFPFQRTLEECSTQEENSGNPFISGADSGLRETHLESASNTSRSEDSLIWSTSLDHRQRPARHETPSTLVHDYDAAPDIAPQFQEVDWHHSPRGLWFSNVDIPPPSPPYSTSDA